MVLSEKPCWHEGSPLFTLSPEIWGSASSSASWVALIVVLIAFMTASLLLVPLWWLQGSDIEGQSEVMCFRRHLWVSSAVGTVRKRTQNWCVLLSRVYFLPLKLQPPAHNDLIFTFREASCCLSALVPLHSACLNTHCSFQGGDRSTLVARDHSSMDPFHFWLKTMWLFHLLGSVYTMTMLLLEPIVTAYNNLPSCVFSACDTAVMLVICIWCAFQIAF